MSHFLIYAARLQDAGVVILTVTLHVREDSTRMMTVTPSGNHYPVETVRQFPARDFELCGTDRLLERLQDDMAYSDGGPTPEMLAAAIERHPLAADDLREWYANWLLNPPPTDEEIAEAEADVDNAMVQRITQRTLGVMRGLEIARTRDAMRSPAGVPVSHTDHPQRHYDRTCPACNPSGVPVAHPTDGERDLAALCARLVRRLREVSPDDKLAATATDYLNQRRYLNPLRIKALEKAAPGVEGDGT